MCVADRAYLRGGGDCRAHIKMCASSQKLDTCTPQSEYTFMYFVFSSKKNFNDINYTSPNVCR